MVQRSTDMEAEIPIDVTGLLNTLDLHLGAERTERVTP